MSNPEPNPDTAKQGAARPVRIALVTTFYPPHNFGGDGIYVQRMANALAALGCEVTVVHDVDAYALLSGNKIDVQQPKETDNPKVIPIQSGLGTLGSLMVQQFGKPIATHKRIQGVLDDRFDVVHFHNVSLIGGPGILSLGTGLKLYTAHEHWLVCPSHILWRHNREVCDGRECFKCQLAHKRPPQLWRYFGHPEKHYAKVDAFIALSESSANNHKAFGFAQPMTVLPSFIPDTVSKEEPAHPNDGKPYAFFAGRLEVIKGIQDVVPQFDDAAPLDLLIAGDGDYREELERLAGGSSRVRFLGRLQPDDLNAYYRYATAVMTPSRCYEVFPLVVLEAFRAGTPIIARNLGSYKEIVDQTRAGFVFDDPSEIMPILKNLMEDESKQTALGKLGRNAFEARWSETPAMLAYFDLIESLAQARCQPALVDSVQQTKARLTASEPS